TAVPGPATEEASNACTVARIRPASRYIGTTMLRAAAGAGSRLIPTEASSRESPDSDSTRRRGRVSAEPRRPRPLAQHTRVPGPAGGAAAVGQEVHVHG